MTDPNLPQGAPPEPQGPHGTPPAPQPGPGATPPPGYGPPPGFGPPPGYAPAPGPPAGASVSQGNVTAPIGALMSLASITAMALAVSLKEDGTNGWDRVGVWAAFAIAAAVLTLAPVVRDNLNLSVERAWHIGAVGAGGLVGYWILIVLPWIEQNVSFLATVGVAAGVWAVWRSPGRPGTEPVVPQTW